MEISHHTSRDSIRPTRIASTPPTATISMPKTPPVRTGTNRCHLRITTTRTTTRTTTAQVASSACSANCSTAIATPSHSLTKR